ncbi:MAG: hypothetical protein HYZ93_00095 [Candidatus Omnitrophica bacterium]|nr:hypothetical protein [Candidatus Omnitrophota bacterium]
MTVSAFLLLFLGVISLCLIVLTAASLSILKDLRRLLRQLQSNLPALSRTLKEFHQTLGVARQILTHTQKASRQVEEALRKTCEAAVDAIEPFATVGERVRSFLSQRFGNGARGRPRRLTAK